MLEPDDSPSPADLAADLPAPERLARAQAALQALDESAGNAAGAMAAASAPLRVLAPMALARGRVHELAGSARRVLAVLTAVAAAREGAVLWLRPGWRAETLCPAGLRALAGGDTGLLEALIVADARREGDILWSMEEALRTGCVALVVGEIGTPPDLRQIRRLHLAAAEGLARARAAGKGQSGLAPLGLLMAQERADSRIAGVESRWAFEALPPEPEALTDRRHDIGPRWRLARLRARDAPPADWVIDPRTLSGDGPARGGTDWGRPERVGQREGP